MSKQPHFVTYTLFKTTVKKHHENNHDVIFEGMTVSKVMALEQALSDYSTKSIVGNDIFLSLKKAIDADSSIRSS